MDTAVPSGQHPYYPVDVAIPHYKPNESDLVPMLGAFGGVIFATVFVVWRSSLLVKPSLNASEQLAITWFALCE